MPNRISSHRLLASLLATGAALSATACNGQVVSVLVPNPAPGLGLGEGGGAEQQQTTGKVDLLFAVDNSSSMRPKSCLRRQPRGSSIDS